MLHLLGQNNQTVRENLAMDVALLFDHDFPGNDFLLTDCGGEGSSPKYCYTPRRRARIAS